MTLLIVKSIGVWFILVVCAILNGLLRENILNPLLGPHIALPVSGLTLALLIFIIAWLFIPFISVPKPAVYWLIGGIWLTITLAFEFLFGHYVAGKSWDDIFQVFDLSRGNLFLFVLLVTTLAPWLVAKLKGLI